MALADDPAACSMILLVALDTATGVNVRRAKALAQHFQEYFHDDCHVEAVTSRKPSALAALLRHLLCSRPRFLYMLNTGIGGVPLTLAARVFGIPVIVDTGDDSTSLAYAMGRPWWQVQIIAVAEGVMIRTAAQVVVRSMSLRAKLQSRLREQTPIALIPDGVYTTPSSPPRRPPNAVFTIGVLGSLHWSRPLQWGYGFETLQVVARCLRRGLECEGVIFGDGPALGHLQFLASGLGIADRIRFQGRLAYDTVQAHLATCDVLLLVAPPHEAFRIRVTGKLAEYAVAGKPILASNTGEWVRFLPRDYVVDWPLGDAEAFYAHLAARTEHLMRGHLEPFRLHDYDPVRDFTRAVLTTMTSLPHL